MSEGDDSDLSKSTLVKILAGVIGGWAVLGLAVSAIGFVPQLGGWFQESKSWERAGQVGDMFNVATSLFSALAFAVLAVALILQGRSYKNQVESYRLARKEFIELKEATKAQTEEIKRQNDAMERQNELMVSQQKIDILRIQCQAICEGFRSAPPVVSQDLFTEIKRIFGSSDGVKVKRRLAQIIKEMDHLGGALDESESAKASPTSAISETA